jgi:CRISPR-associated protein Csd2
MSILQTKFDIIYLLEAIDANPNGDPDQEGAPRQDPDTGHGLMSPGCINRKLRNYVQRARDGEAPFAIQIQRGNSSIERTIIRVAEKDPELAALIPVSASADEGASEEATDKKAKKKAKAKSKGKKPGKAQLTDDQTTRLTRALCDNYWDVRMFGGVNSVGNMPAGKTTGAAATMFARSIDPVDVNEGSLTRCMTANEEQRAEKDREMGRYHRIPYGLFKGTIHINPFHAQTNGCQEEDLSLLLEALIRCWDLDRTSFRGTLNIKGLWVVRHSSPLGSCRGDRIQSALKVKSSDPSGARSFDDYEVDFGALPDSVRVFTLDEIDDNPMCVFADLDAEEAAE